MPTSNSSVAVTGRVPLRLRTAQPGRGRLDGGWWPQSRHLAVELADLVEHFPPQLGRIVRALYSPPDWDTGTLPDPVLHGAVKVRSFPGDEHHLLDVSTSDRTVLRLLVVPVALSGDQGEEALLAAATPGNSRTAASLLETVLDSPDVERLDRWNDEGGSWWDPHPTPPSWRNAL
jgi:hypothetical protein